MRPQRTTRGSQYPFMIGASDAFGQGALGRDLRFYNYALSKEEAELRVNLREGLVQEMSPEEHAGELEVFGTQMARTQLVQGPGGEGNDAFELSESLLSTRRIFNYEDAYAYPIRVRASLPLGFFKDTVLPVRIEDVTAPYVELLPLAGINILQGHIVHDGGSLVGRVGFEVSLSPFFSQQS